MIGNGTVEEEGVGIVHDLLEDEVFQLKTRSKGGIGSGVARGELRALGNCVVVSAPNELDGVTDGSVDGEGNVTEDTLGRSNIDNVSLAGLGRGVIVRRHRRRVLGLTLLDTIVVRVAVTSPVVASGTVGGGRCTGWRKGAVGRSVGRGRGIVVATIGVVVTTVRIVIPAVGVVVVTAIRIVIPTVGIVAAVVHIVTTRGGERGRRTPST